MKHLVLKTITEFLTAESVNQECFMSLPGMKTKMEVERIAGPRDGTERASAEGEAAASFSEKHTALALRRRTHKGTLKSPEAPKNYFSEINHTPDLLTNHLLVSMNQQITKGALSVS